MAFVAHTQLSLCGTRVTRPQWVALYRILQKWCCPFLIIFHHLYTLMTSTWLLLKNRIILHLYPYAGVNSRIPFWKDILTGSVSYFLVFIQLTSHIFHVIRYSFWTQPMVKFSKSYMTIEKTAFVTYLWICHYTTDNVHLRCPILGPHIHDHLPQLERYIQCHTNLCRPCGSPENDETIQIIRTSGRCRFADMRQYSATRGGKSW